MEQGSDFIVAGRHSFGYAALLSEIQGKAEVMDHAGKQIISDCILSFG